MASEYPGFDVMAERRAWDPFTRSVVGQRLQLKAPRRLREAEARTLRAVAGRLLAEERPEVLDFVVAHFDQRLAANVGEGQRAPDVPPEAELLRRGLAALDGLARGRGGKGGFGDLPVEEQDALLRALSQGRLSPADAMAGIPQKPLFQKLLAVAADAWASHPSVWSEIGYAGPAYPRGYYRMGRGILDPWEPRAAKGLHDGQVRGHGPRAARPAGPDAGRARAGGAPEDGQLARLAGYAVGDGRRDANPAPGTAGADDARTGASDADEPDDVLAPSGSPRERG
jgi:hypothetical protein